LSKVWVIQVRSTEDYARHKRVKMWSRKMEVVAARARCKVRDPWLAGHLERSKREGLIN
jgi:hypothetical protein